MRILSFRYAAKGIIHMFRTQHNALIHLAFTFAVIVCGLFFQITTIEWCIVFLSIGGVFAAELFNSAIELLTDKVSPGFDTDAGNIKDMAAGGVLVAAIFAALAGLFIFIPALLNYLKT